MNNVITFMKENIFSLCALIFSMISIFIAYRTNKKNMYYRLLDDRNRIYEAISDFVEYNYGYNGCGRDIWELFEASPDYLQDEIYYRDEEKIIFDNLRKAHQYFPARKKEIQRVQKLLEEYRKLHIQRAHNSFEGQDKFFEANTPAEVTSRINNHEEKRLERIQSIKRTLDFHQLLKKLEKDIY